MTSRHQKKALATTPAAPIAKIQGPLTPKSPSPPFIERIQMMSPTAMNSTDSEAVTGHGLGLTR